MQLDEAVRMVEALADGHDPATGASLPAESVIQRPEIVRALYTVLHELERLTEDKSQPGASQAKAGSPWSAQEEADVVREFEAHMPLQKIAEKHGRTVAAIHGRLYLLGKLPAYRPGAARA